MPSIFVSTQDGLHTLDDKGDRMTVNLAGRDVTTIASEREELWAIIDHTEVWHASDIDKWAYVGGLDHHRGTCIAATAEDVFVGSSDARLFRVATQGLEPVGSFDRAEGRSDWYTPWGGPPDTRSIAEWDDVVYVNVHVGGILRTEDRGETWTPTIDIDADIHQVTTAEGLVLAACARGLAVSADRGGTWTIRSDGLDAPYSRAIAVCGDALLLSASKGPGGERGAVYRGDLSGGALERCRTGLPEWFDDNIDSYCLDAPPEGSVVAFGTSDGRVFASEDVGASWAEVASGLPPVQRVLVMP